MKLTVLACPNHGVLESCCLELMKKYTHISSGGAAVIVPDQSSFAEEERIIENFGTVGLGNPEVLSFKRLFYKLSAKFPSGRKRLTSSAREMAVAYALNDIDQADLRLFSGVVKKRELSSTVSSLIAGFKRYGVTAEKLSAADKGMEQSSPLQKKIHDCFKALESYDRLMEQASLCDSDDDMRELAEILENNRCDFFSNKTVFIRYFSDLNCLQLQCVGGICQKADAVFAAVCWDDCPEFATVKKLIDALKRTAQKNGCEFELKVLSISKDNRPPALRYLSENYYREEATAYDKTVGRSLFLHASKNPAEEVRHVGAAIARLVKSGQRYRDITVAARDIEKYAGYIKRIFPTYSIPVFADEKRPLARHSASGYILSAMELAVHGFTHENVFGFAKNPFAPHEGRCGKLEDYCVEAGIRSWNWREDFTFIRGAYSSQDYSGEVRQEDLTLINDMRREILELIEPLEKILEKPRSGEDFARGLYEFMEKSSLSEKAETAALKQEESGDLRGGGETRQVYNLLIDILDDVCTVFGEREIDPVDFYEAIKAACSAVQIGVVPPVSDSVTYGDIERMKGRRDKYVFVLGLNEDIFPRAFADSSIFTEYEAETLLDQWDIRLPPGGAEKSENEKLLVYEAVSFAEKRLYLSYSLGGADGRNLRPSSIVQRVKELFPKLRETEDLSRVHGEFLCATKAAAFLELGTAMGENRQEKFWQLMYAMLNADPIYGKRLKLLEKNKSYSSIETQDLDPALLKKVTGEEIALSPSRLESYGGCPFSYFMQYILRLRDCSPMNINFTDSGNILHNIIDGFCARVSKDLNGSWQKASQEYTDKVFGEVCGEIRRGLSRQIAADPRLKAAVERIEITAKKCIEEIKTQIEEELFIPTGNEIVIGKDGNIPPTLISLPDGTKARFTGRIDRADKRMALVEQEDKSLRMTELVRIIDYKSSRKDVDFNKLLNGLQLQLFAYMDSYLNAYPESRPAAVLYFNLSPAAAELPIGEEQPPRLARLGGVAVEGRMEGGEGILSVNEAEMKTLLNYVRLSVRRTARSISQGKMPVSPARTDGRLNCGFCPYIGICRFDVWGSGRCVRDIPPSKGKEAIKTMDAELMSFADEKEQGNEA